MKSFIMFSFSKDVLPESVIEALQNPDLQFKDFSTPTQSVTAGFCDVAKNIPYVFNQSCKLLHIDYKIRKKTVPAAVLKERIAEENERLLSLTGTKMSKQEEREFKELLLEELLPHAYPKTSITTFYLDFNSCVVYTNTTNWDNAASILGTLNRVLGETNQPTLDLNFIEKKVPFSSTMKSLILNRFFNSNINEQAETPIHPTGNYTVVGEGQISANNSKISFNNISCESDELHQTLTGGTRFISSIGLNVNDETFIVSEDFTFTNVKLNEYPKFDPNAISLDMYLEGKLLFNINSMANLYNSVIGLLKLGNEMYGESEQELNDSSEE